MDEGWSMRRSPSLPSSPIVDGGRLLMGLVDPNRRRMTARTVKLSTVMAFVIIIGMMGASFANPISEQWPWRGTVWSFPSALLWALIAWVLATVGAVATDATARTMGRHGPPHRDRQLLRRALGVGIAVEDLARALAAMSGKQGLEDSDDGQIHGELTTAVLVGCVLKAEKILIERATDYSQERRQKRSAHKDAALGARSSQLALRSRR
jgi:hypothetical protein